ncbi:MAG: DUF2723 domain-containing protein, partial [Chloroflexota bacterium]
RQTDWGIAVALFIVTLVVYARTLAPTLTWQHDGADGGDLVSAAANFAVPHPSGYPTYMLLARAFLLVPWGDEAYRLNLMSALCASAAIALFYWLALVDDAWVSRMSALTAALLLAFAPAVWLQATITEVYTLHLLFIVASLVALRRWRRQRRARDAFAVGLLIGLGLGNHLTMGLVALAVVSLRVAAAVSRRRSNLHYAEEIASPAIMPQITQKFHRSRRIPNPPPAAGLPLVANPAGAGSFCLHAVRTRSGVSRNDVLAATASLALGLCVYLYLPLASRFGSNLHWGRVDTFDTFAAHVGGELYRGYVFGVPLAAAPQRLVALVAMLLNEFQVWGVVFTVVGLATFRRDAAWSLALATLALGSIVFAVGYNTRDSLRYLLPCWVVVAVWCADGMRATLNGLTARRALVAALALLLIVGGVAAWRWPSLDLSGDHEAEQFALRVLTPLPARAMLVSASDRQTFALWYYTEVRRVRSDVIVVDRDLFGYAPYRAELGARGARSNGLKNHLEPLSFDEFVKSNLGSRRIFVLDPTAGLSEIMP